MQSRAKQLEEPERRLLTISEAARILGIGRSALWARIAMRDVPVVRMGGRLTRIDRHDLDAYIAARRTGEARR